MAHFMGHLLLEALNLLHARPAAAMQIIGDMAARLHDSQILPLPTCIQN